MAEAELSWDQNQRECVRAKLSRADSGVVLEPSGPVSVVASASTLRPTADERMKTEPAKWEEEVVSTELSLFAVPSTPPSTKLLITHSRTQSLTSPPRKEAEEGAPTLFALPNTSLDESFEEFTPTTPTTKYAQDFPALSFNSTPKISKVASVQGSKRSSKEVEGLARSPSKNGRNNKGQTGGKTATKRNSRVKQGGS